VDLKCQSISLMTILIISVSLLNYGTFIIPITACVILEHTLFCQVSKSVRAELSLSDTKFMSTCSFTIQFKKVSACLKVFVE